MWNSNFKKQNWFCSLFKEEKVRGDEGNLQTVVSTASVVARYMVIDNFNKCFIEAVGNYLCVDLKVEDIQTLFSTTFVFELFKNKKVVLIMDEIDSITELSLSERKAFLSSLSTMKQIHQGTYCLYSCLAITNWVGEYLGQTIGNSPFNVASPAYGDYFSIEEANLFWDQYEKESKKQIKTAVRDQIYNMTLGAQGQTVMLTLYYQSQCTDNTFISDATWYSAYLSNNFWMHISNYQNFQRITSVLKQEEVARSLLDWFKDSSKVPDGAIINTLVKSNILRWKKSGEELDYASPFIKRYILDRIIAKIECPALTHLPVLQNGQFDFVTCLKEVVWIVCLW